ncbi:hypothetical protein [Mesoplasma melaleucae]|nr:hypothetical protein [Mesoplasma melaleucae]
MMFFQIIFGPFEPKIWDATLYYVFLVKAICVLTKLAKPIQLVIDIANITRPIVLAPTIKIITSHKINAGIKEINLVNSIKNKSYSE